MNDDNAVRQWADDNQQYLAASLALAKDILQFHLDNVSEKEKHIDALKNRILNEEQRLKTLAENMAEPPALLSLTQIFNLTNFECFIVLMCAGVELEASYSHLYAALRKDPQRTRPTFGLALSSYPDAHWSALVPRAALRYWRLIEIDSGDSLTTASLRLDERILHYLIGLHYLDEKLQGFIKPLPIANRELIKSHESLVGNIERIWEKVEDIIPVIQLCGKEPETTLKVAQQAAINSGMNLHYMSSSVLPATASELEALIRLWDREALLGNDALALDCNDSRKHDNQNDVQIKSFLENINSTIVVLSRERINVKYRANYVIEVKKPTIHEQKLIWQQELGAEAKKINGQIHRLINSFDLNAHSISDICQQALSVTGKQNSLAAQLWTSSILHSRPKLDDLAQRIQPAASWGDLVLPKSQLKVLKDITLQVKNRYQVYEQWGFSTKNTRGLGISALFAGSSGTGKTMAAEVLANELKLDLYIIDLSQVVSKYIGETEKNLAKVFDAAEEGGTILLFDEADAIFGKRSEVKDSHDRYANIEVSYLLQRMESYRGLAILTTNMKSAIDEAFLRRIRFVVNFPFPNKDQRAKIWQRIFPNSTPVENIDYQRLAGLNIAGGNIKNIAVQAAFFAAEEQKSVSMEQILKGARNEYSKLEKPLTDDLGVRDLS